MPFVPPEPPSHDLRAPRSRKRRPWVWLSAGCGDHSPGGAPGPGHGAESSHRSGPALQRCCWRNFPGFHPLVPNLSSREISSYQGKGTGAKGAPKGQESPQKDQTPSQVSTKMPTPAVACRFPQLETPSHSIYTLGPNTHLARCTCALVPIDGLGCQGSRLAWAQFLFPAGGYTTRWCRGRENRLECDTHPPAYFRTQ